MAWGWRHVVSTGRLQWQVWTVIKEVGWEHIDFPKENTFLSFQRYLSAIIWCCVHSIHVNWNKFLFAQVAAEATLSHCNSTKLHKTESMQHSFCPSQDHNFMYQQPEVAKWLTRMSPGSQIAKDIFVNKTTRIMYILVSERGQGPFPRLETNWHSTALPFWLNPHLQKQSDCVQAVHWELSLVCDVCPDLAEDILGMQYLQQVKSLG